MTPVWDLPTRLFHWAVVFIVALAWWSAEEERYSIHEWAGYSLLTLLLTRIVWGFIGSRHSRFSDFLAGPSSIVAFLKGAAPNSPGHNPLGGWSVVALLGLLLLQAVSGLFNTDDVFFNGPLYYAAEGGFRDAMGQVHDIAFNVLLGLVGLHLVVVFYHQWVKRDGMIRAMITGSAPGRVGQGPVTASWKALLILVVVAGLIWWGLEQAPQPQPLW